MFRQIKDRLFGKKEVEAEPKIVINNSRGRGGWKSDKYTLSKDKGKRFRFNYRFDSRLEYVCKCYKSDEEQLVKTIESLISKRV